VAKAQSVSLPAAGAAFLAGLREEPAASPAMPLRTRLAPTPSGYLHLGNAVNFLLTWLLARSQGGTVRLRIDDGDCARTRPEFIEDIFRQLDWLGLTWDEGPQGPDDFAHNHSQLQRIDRYRLLLAELGNVLPLFSCRCSRKKIRAASQDGLYPGTCRGRTEIFAGPCAVRVPVPEQTLIAAGQEEVALARVMGDFLLWRRDDLPAYQLTSLADDIDHRITCIVRGQDLLSSTAAQLFLATALGEAGFSACRFLHHPLLFCPAGKKLAKSDNALSLMAMREAGLSPAAVYRQAARLLGLDAGAGASLADLEHFCKATFRPRP
jgi:glutamyl-tRNA synthetase